MVARRRSRPTTAYHFSAGGTWTIQGWFLDATGPCGTGINLTNALEVTF